MAQPSSSEHGSQDCPFTRARIFIHYRIGVKEATTATFNCWIAIASKIYWKKRDPGDNPPHDLLDFRTDFPGLPGNKGDFNKKHSFKLERLDDSDDDATWDDVNQRVSKYVFPHGLHGVTVRRKKEVEKDDDDTGRKKKRRKVHVYSVLAVTIIAESTVQRDNWMQALKLRVFSLRALFLPKEISNCSFQVLQDWISNAFPAEDSKVPGAAPKHCGTELNEAAEACGIRQAFELVPNVVQNVCKFVSTCNPSKAGTPSTDLGNAANMATKVADIAKCVSIVGVALSVISAGVWPRRCTSRL